MNDQPHMPDPAVDSRLIANLRRTRLEMEELGLQLEEVIAKLEEHNRQQRMKRLELVLDNCATQAQLTEQNSTEVLS